MKTQGPYEARHCPGIPTDCCDFGIVSLSQGREVCRVWDRDDAEHLAKMLNSAPADTEKLVAVADAIDAARYAHPQNPRLRPRPFADADPSDQEYAIRLARAAIAAL